MSVLQIQRLKFEEVSLTAPIHTHTIIKWKFKDSNLSLFDSQSGVLN